MMQHNDFASLGKCGDFCSECKFVFNSIYNIGTASSIDDCKSVTDEELKDSNSLLNKRVKTPNENIINENDKELNNSNSKLPLLTSHIKHKNSDKSEEEIQVLFHKKFKQVDRVHEELNEFNEIYIPHDYGKYSTHLKPAIIEDKILRSSEKLKINKWKKQKSQISNYKCDHSKYFKSDKGIKNVDKICEDITDDSRNLNRHGIDKQSVQFTDSCNVIPTYSKCQSTLNKAHTTRTSDYFSQYNTLKHAILNRRKKVFNIANHLLTLSAYLDGIRKTILETEDSNPSSICPNINVNSSKKIDKSTSPILFSKTHSTVTDLALGQEDGHDMYKYNPYSSRNILQKKCDFNTI